MANEISPRLNAIVKALPIRACMRVLEVGCGPGVAARALIQAYKGKLSVLAIDRSARAILQARQNSKPEIKSGKLEFRQSSIEDFELRPGEKPFDLAFAVRVGALDGRHPEQGEKAFEKLLVALKPGAKLFIDGGDPLIEIKLPKRNATGKRKQPRSG